MDRRAWAVGRGLSGRTSVGGQIPRTVILVGLGVGRSVAVMMVVAVPVVAEEVGVEVEEEEEDGGRSM